MYGTASILLVWKLSFRQREEHEASDRNTSPRISAVPDLEMFGVHSAHITCTELPRNSDEDTNNFEHQNIFSSAFIKVQMTGIAQQMSFIRESL